jgi:hypothetical protein
MSGESWRILGEASLICMCQRWMKGERLAEGGGGGQSADWKNNGVSQEVI